MRATLDSSREGERKKERGEEKERERENVRKASVSVIKNASYKGRERERTCV